MSPSSDKEKLDLRRIQGQISCAECRRLKLKCDKKNPCSSCVRRGCDSICPTGTLANGMGKKLVLSDTGDLHRAVENMGDRIKQLEAAIEQFQAAVSPEAHPLLRPDLLLIKFPPGLAIPTQRPASPTLELADAFGTLAINDQGNTKYFGSTAGAESLFLAGAEIRHETRTSRCALANAAPPVERNFPLGENADWDLPRSLEIVCAHLPSRSRAVSLAKTYYHHGPWSGQVVTPDELFQDIIEPLYKYIEDRDVGILSEFPISCHKLASLFGVLAIGVLVDLNLPAYHPDGERYAQVLVASLILRRTFVDPETGTVQALTLLAVFLNHGGRKYSMEGAWSLSSLAMKLLQRLGLHRESERHDIDPKTTDRNKRLFWETFSFDCSLSLKLGRPHTMPADYIRCPFPIDEEETLDAEGNIISGFHHLKWTLARDLTCKVMEVILSAKSPSYKSILDLDRLMRQTKYTNKRHFSHILQGENSHLSFSHAFALKHYRATVGIYIHRSYFAQAIATPDPLCSPYAASYLAAYRCASGLISVTLKYYDSCQELLMRCWSLWSSLFSAAIITGTVAIRTPDRHLASRSFAEFCLAVELFETAASQSPRAGNGLAILRRMRDKAVALFSQQDVDMVADYSSKPRIDTSDFDDELEIFAGRTRLMVSKMLVKERRRMPPRPVSPLTTMPEPQSQTTPLQENQQSLVDFFVMQMGPSWTTPRPDETLPIPQLPYDYDFSANFDTGTASVPQAQETPFVPDYGHEYDFGAQDQFQFMKLLDDYVMNPDIPTSAEASTERGGEFGWMSFPEM